MNSFTVRDSYPLLAMNELLNSLVDARIYSIEDVNSRYAQIIIDIRDQQTMSGSFHNRRLSFSIVRSRLRNAPTIFQHVMDIVLSAAK